MGALSPSFSFSAEMNCEQGGRENLTKTFFEGGDQEHLTMGFAFRPKEKKYHPDKLERRQIPLQTPMQTRK